MTTTHLTQAAMLQLIAEGMRSPSAGILSVDQLQRFAGILDRIAVDLMVPSVADDDDRTASGDEALTDLRLHS